MIPAAAATPVNSFRFFIGIMCFSLISLHLVVARIGDLAVGYETTGAVLSGFRRIAAFEFWLPQLRRAHLCLSVGMSGIRVGARAPGDSVECSATRPGQSRNSARSRQARRKQRNNAKATPSKITHTSKSVDRGPLAVCNRKERILNRTPRGPSARITTRSSQTEQSARSTMKAGGCSLSRRGHNHAKNGINWLCHCVLAVCSPRVSIHERRETNNMSINLRLSLAAALVAVTALSVTVASAETPSPPGVAVYFINLKD